MYWQYQICLFKMSIKFLQPKYLRQGTYRIISRDANEVIFKKSYN